MSSLDLNKVRTGEVNPDIISTISHELRTPLSIIREFISLVYDEVPGPINDRQRVCLESALRNCDRQATLINNILDASKSDFNRLPYNRRRTNIKLLIDEIVGDYSLKFEKKSQLLSLEYEESLPDVLCAPDQITQVLLNLLSNARRYTPEGGRITIKAHSNQEYVTVHVIDEGIGIGQDQLSRIYEIFVRINSTQANATRGSGLGLAISKDLIEQNGGEIHVKSKPGEGSDFYVTIPVYNKRVQYEAALLDHARPIIASGKPLSLVLVRFRMSENIRSRDREVKLRELSEGIKETLQNNIISSTDRVLSTDTEDIIAIVLETDRAGSKAAADRLIRALCDKYDYISRFASSQHSYTSNTCTWPELKRLIRAAERKLKSKDKAFMEVHNGRQQDSIS